MNRVLSPEACIYSRAHPNCQVAFVKKDRLLTSMSSLDSIYEFGHFRLDPTEQVLFCAGKPVPVTLKAFAVLRVLVEHNGHLVTRNDLMRQVWLDAYVEEGNLSQAVCAL